ncbi:uncharacterized protein [Epargyreus clarus]|uniref:uncharacterized protein n=1 Tax=Epargyreus clarus TaxID=520877 RepID=UPI003C2F75E8
MACSGAIENTAEEPKKELDVEKKKKLNDDVVVFIRKRSGLDAPRLIAKLKSYVDFQNKRRRADAVRKRAEEAHGNRSRKRVFYEQKGRPAGICDHRGGDDEQKN